MVAQWGNFQWGQGQYADLTADTVTVGRRIRMHAEVNPGPQAKASVDQGVTARATAYSEEA